MFAPPKGRQPRTPTHLTSEENENSVAVRFRRAGALQEMERHQKNRYGEKVADVNVMDSLVPEVVHRKQATMRPKSRVGRQIDDPTQKMEAIAKSALEMRSSMEGELRKLRDEKERTKQQLKHQMDSELAKLKRERSLAQAELRRSMEAEVTRIRAEKDREINELKEKTMRRPVSLPTGPRGVPNSARSSVSSVSSPESMSQTQPRRLIKRLPLRSQSAVDVFQDESDEVRQLRKRNAELVQELKKTRPQSAACLETAPFSSSDFFAATTKTEDHVGLLASCLDQFPEKLRQGSFLWKVPFHATGAAPQKRWFRVALRKAPSHAPDQQEVVITWGASEHKAEATASKDRSVALEDVLELRPGHKTQAWWVQANAGRLIPPEDLCWSLVCKDRTLDLAAEDSEDAKAWRRGLRGAIQVLQTARRKRFAGDEDNATVDSDDEEVRSVASDSLLGSPRHDVAAPRFRLALERGDCVAARRLLSAAKVNGGDAVLANRSYGTDTGAKMETPLHGAARTGNVLLVQLLLEHHADARARDGTGATPAHVAIRAKADGARDVLAVLLDAAGDDVLEARDNAGDVPLHVACRAGALECVRLLLETAADPQAKNNMGETPSDCASGHVLALVAEYAPPVEDDNAFDLGGVTWRARVDPASSYPYFENEATGATQWADPRTEASEAAETEPEVVEVAEDEAEASEAAETEPEVVAVAEAPAAAPDAPAEAPAPAPKKHTPTRDWDRKPLFSITNSVEATG